MKLTCIIDTCSCISLGYSEFRQKTLLWYLNDKTNLYYSKEVGHELKDHSWQGISSYILNSKKYVHLPQMHSTEEYEKRMYGTPIPTRVKGGNKGEVDNFIVAVDQIHRIEKGAVIYITDDDKAVNGILNGWIDAFPAMKLWNSYDVVLYLYAEKIIPTKDFAVEMIRDLFDKTAPKEIINGNDSLLREVTRKKYFGLFKNYTDRIEKVRKIIN